MSQILIIDDDPQIRNIIKIQLHNQDIKVCEAESQEQAFQTLAGQSIDMVLCDIKMKDVDGINLLKAIKSTYKNIPVVMLTGFIDKETSKRAFAEGCFDFITKPVKREKLIDIIKKAINCNKGDVINN